MPARSMSSAIDCVSTGGAGAAGTARCPSRRRGRQSGYDRRHRRAAVGVRPAGGKGATWPPAPRAESSSSMSTCVSPRTSNSCSFFAPPLARQSTQMQHQRQQSSTRMKTSQSTSVDTPVPVSSASTSPVPVSRKGGGGDGRGGMVGGGGRRRGRRGRRRRWRRRGRRGWRGRGRRRVVRRRGRRGRRRGRRRRGRRRRGLAARAAAWAARAAAARARAAAAAGRAGAVARAAPGGMEALELARAEHAVASSGRLAPPPRSSQASAALEEHAGGRGGSGCSSGAARRPRARVEGDDRRAGGQLHERDGEAGPLGAGAGPRRARQPPPTAAGSCPSASRAPSARSGRAAACRADADRAGAVGVARAVGVVVARAVDVRRLVERLGVGLAASSPGAAPAGAVFAASSSVVSDLAHSMPAKPCSTRSQMTPPRHKRRLQLQPVVMHVGGARVNDERRPRHERGRAGRAQRREQLGEAASSRMFVRSMPRGASGRVRMDGAARRAGLPATFGGSYLKLPPHSLYKPIGQTDGRRAWSSRNQRGALTFPPGAPP